MPAKLAVRSRADAPHLKKASLAIEQAAWSGLGYLSYTRAHYEYYAELLDAYPEYQLCLVDEETDYPVAVASSVPFVCSGPEDLPQEGWDWVVETAARTKDMRPNMLGALAAYAASMLTLTRCDVVPTYLVAGLGVSYERLARRGTPLRPLELTPWLALQMALVTAAFLGVTYVYIRFVYRLFL